MQLAAAVQDEPRVGLSRRWRRLALAGAALLGLAALALYLGLDRYADREALRLLLDGAGGWGVALFLAAFVLGTLLQVPGLVFIGAAVLAFGHCLGAVVAFLGAVLAVTVNFLLVRWVGGRALAEVRSPLLRRLLARLETRPYLVVALLRTVFVVSPPLNSALALSSLRLRDFVLGSALGLLVPVAATAAVLRLAF